MSEQVPNVAINYTKKDDNDINNILNYRLDTELFGENQARHIVTSVQVGKPRPHEFFQSHPDDSYSFTAMVILYDRDLYIVNPKLYPDCENIISPREFRVVITRSGHLYMVPIRPASPSGQLSEWSKQLYTAHRLAKNNWVRIQANMTAGTYDIFEAISEIPAPVWPELSFEEMLSLAFNDITIDSLDHKIIKQFRGIE